ncbi:hypothetical protein [Flammeovirga agarivorans]|uniref:Uncharacterized protein n=1 Tax=Flammeovirga agarivorans TaxID=2726742 RepID=A0A7X8XYA5_9BACT|nr:hypothetical protein [Flammeovirga agarivorans]NLR94021.1 hypothetical protein [Flammeovirga agarivorans]
MYFEGIITIDPSQLTQIERVKPTKAFKRIFYYMTLGNVSDQVEKETFTAVSILQQINNVLIHNGIDNIVRLSHDGIDFYLDVEGKEGDLKEAFDQYDLEIDHSMSSQFNKLVMVMEHEDHNFKYLLEIDINRTHDVGEYPIEIKVTGLLKQFKKENKSRGEIEEEMKSIFKDQESYNIFKSTQQHNFEQFLNDLKLSIIKLMHVDDVKVDIKSKIILPNDKIQEESELKYHKTYGEYGVHYGYFGFGDFLFYNMLWSNMSYNNDITLYDTHFETEIGEDLGFRDEIIANDEIFNDEVESDFEEFQLSGIESTLDDPDNRNASSWFDFSGVDYNDDDSGVDFDFGSDDSDW